MPAPRAADAERLGEGRAPRAHGDPRSDRVPHLCGRGEPLARRALRMAFSTTPACPSGTDGATSTSGSGSSLTIMLHQPEEIGVAKGRLEAQELVGQGPGGKCPSPGPIGRRAPARATCSRRMPTATPARVMPVDEPIVFAIPKSMIFTPPSSRTRTFEGLMSRWITLLPVGVVEALGDPDEDPPLFLELVRLAFEDHRREVAAGQELLHHERACHSPCRTRRRP